VSDAQTITDLLHLERESAALWESLPGEAAARTAEQEAIHARGLERALRGMGRQAPSRTFTSTRGSLRDALELEDELVRAYSEAMRSISNARLLAPLASICANHGQHLVILRGELGNDPLTRAFEPVE
jgi:ferritin-like protein